MPTIQESISEICRASAAMIVSVNLRLGIFDSNLKFDSWRRSLPELNAIYAKTLEHHYEVAVHAEADIFPYKILRTKAPNQSEAEWNYQCGLYECYTRSTWTRALNKTKVISNKQNYSITGWDEEQRKYFYEDYPQSHSIESFFFEIVREAKVNYPNQLLLIEPKTIPTKKDLEGNIIPDQSVQVEPICKLIKEEDIIQYFENELTVIKKGSLMISGQNWPIFRSYDKDYIYLSVPEKEGEKIIYVTSVLYEHNWGYVPCRKLGGKAKDIDGEIFYESIFAGALPDLNEVIRLSSTLSMVMHKNAYPVEVRRDKKCTHVTNGLMCDNGFVWDPTYSGSDGQLGGKIPCSGCNGTGKGPTTVFTVAETLGFGSEKFLPLGEVLAYVAPSPETISPLREEIQLKKEDAFSHIFKSSEKIQQTAEGSHLEKDEYHSMIVEFSNGTFDLLEFAIEGCGWYRYQEKFQKPNVTRPTTFSFRSPEDITSELSESRSSNMPVAYDQALVSEAAKTRFNSNPNAVSLVDATMRVSDLWAYQDSDLIPWLGKSVRIEDVIVKQRAQAFISRAITEHADFLSMETARQKEIVYAYATEELNKMPQMSDEFAADKLAMI